MLAKRVTGKRSVSYLLYCFYLTGSQITIDRHVGVCSLCSEECTRIHGIPYKLGSVVQVLYAKIAL